MFVVKACLTGFAVSESPIGTPEACFLHRVPQKPPRVHQEAVFSTARSFGTSGSLLLYRAFNRYTRSPSPIPSAFDEGAGEGGAK